MEEENKEKNKNERPKFIKKTSLILEQKNKLKLKNNFDKVNKGQSRRCYSTKTFSNFVPQIKPKKSFCKPTPFKLNDNPSNQNENESEKSFELDKISSCDEGEESNRSSSLLSSSFENDEENNDNNKINENTVNEKENNDEHKLDNGGDSASKKDDNDSSYEYEDITQEKKELEEKGKEKNDINNLKNETPIITHKNILRPKESHQNLKNDFCLENNFDDENNNNNTKDFDINKKYYLSQKKCIFNNNITILDILSFRNKKN